MTVFPTYAGRSRGTGSGFEAVERLPEEPEDGKAFYLERDQREAFTLDDFDLAFTAASLGANNRIGFASAAGAAAYANANNAGGALAGASAGIAVFARNVSSIEFIVTNALANQLGREVSIYVDGTAHVVPRQALPAGHSVTRAGMTLYVTGGADLAAGDQWAVGDTPTIRLQSASGEYLLPGGTFAGVGDENPAGDIEYRSGYYIVQDGRYVRLPAGFEPVERLPQEPEAGRAFYLERDQQAPYTADDFNLDFDTGVIDATLPLHGYASAAGVAISSAITAVAGSLDGADAAGIHYLYQHGGQIVIGTTRAAHDDTFGDPITFALIDNDGNVSFETPVPVHSRFAASVIYATAQFTLAAGDRWGDGENLVIRLQNASGAFMSKDGTFGQVGDEKPAGALLYESGYYIVIDGEYVQVDPLAAGGVPAVRLKQAGNDRLGLLVGFEREGAGAPWTMDTIDGTGAPATTRVPAAGANYVTFRFPEFYGDGAAGNTAVLNVVQRAGAIAVETAQNGNEFVVTLYVPAATTMAGLQAGLRALPNWEDADVVATGAGGTAFPSAAGGNRFQFAGGRDHVLELEVDTDTETVELTYHNGIPQQELMDFLDGNETDEGTFRCTHIGDTDLAASPEPAPFEGRAFDQFYSGGVRPRRTPEGYTDIVARRAAEAAQTSADQAGAAARTAYDEARSRLGSIVFGQANSQAGLDAAIAEADGSGDLYFLNIVGPFQDSLGFQYTTGMTFVWVQSVPGFAQIDENFDPDTIVRLLSFTVHYVSSAAELATALRTLNNRNGGLVAITADFSSGGVDYVDGERYMWDTADERLRLFYSLPPGPPAATAATPGIVALSNAAPLGPRAAGGSAGADTLVSRQDHQHPLPSFAQVQKIIDDGTGSTVWRSAHVVLRTAVETRDLLATVLGANWWQADGSAGITLDEALDGVGAALAMLQQFTYDAAANTFTFTLPDDFVTAAMVLAGTAAEKAAWRGEIGAAHIGAANDLPGLDDHNVGDVWIIAGNPTPGGNSFVDISNQAVVLNDANPFDVMLVFPGGRGVAKQWTRVGTIGGINAAVQAALDAKADLATLPATISEALPPFFSITHAPAGIGGGRAAADYPDYIDVVFSEKQTGRTITGATLSIGGAPLPLDASTPISGIDAANELRGLLQFNLTSVGNATRINLAAQVTRHNSRFLPGQLTITFDEGDPHVHDFAWPVQNPAFAIPGPPAVVQAYTAAALTLNNANVTVAQTARITPRSTTTRVRVSGHVDAVFANARNNNDNDRFQKLAVSIYRGDVLVISRTYGNSKVGNGAHIELAPDIEWIDSPRSAAEQTYTLRLQRIAPGARNVTVTDRHLIVEEVL